MGNARSKKEYRVGAVYKRDSRGNAMLKPDDGGMLVVLDGSAHEKFKKGTPYEFRVLEQLQYVELSNDYRKMPETKKNYDKPKTSRKRRRNKKRPRKPNISGQATKRRKAPYEIRVVRIGGRRVDYDPGQVYMLPQSIGGRMDSVNRIDIGWLLKTFEGDADFIKDGVEAMLKDCTEYLGMNWYDRRHVDVLGSRQPNQDTYNLAFEGVRRTKEVLKQMLG